MLGAVDISTNSPDSEDILIKGCEIPQEQNLQSTG